MIKFKYLKTYYEKIIQLLLENNRKVLSEAAAGHCLKITGLGLNDLIYLWEILNKEFKNLDSFIIGEDITQPEKFITPTKLIELRNQQQKPLLILIPSNTRTAAEDSYGNATFKEIGLDGIEDKLLALLKDSIPTEYDNIIKNEILAYIRKDNKNVTNVLHYLLALEVDGYTEKNIGDYIYHLGLIPDSNLIIDIAKIRNRLNSNLKSIDALTMFEKPIYDRLIELPIESNSNQEEIVNFFKAETDLKNSFDVCERIFSKYPNLNFANWKIPDLDPNHVKLYCNEVTSKNLKIESGINVIRTSNNKSVKLKVRFTTIPNPKDVRGLRFFKIILMKVNGGGGDEIMILRKVNYTDSNRPYREATIDFNPNLIEEGSYFLKVHAEDEHGNLINNNDDFKDARIQKEWEEALKRDPLTPKSTFDFKLTCDSEDFDFLVEDEIEKDTNTKKNKVNYVLQSYFKFRVELLKKKKDLVIPTPINDSNVWISDSINKHTSVFHICYSDLHNYQISISKKLRKIQDLFLDNPDQFGIVNANLSSNPSILNFEYLKFIPSVINEIIPPNLLALRSKLFNLIKHSNAHNNGIVETADLFNFSNEIKEYISELTIWTTELKKQISDSNTEQNEKDKLQKLFAQLQILDTVKVKTRLADGKSVDAILLSPIHPLRLSWFLQLFEVFSNWESKTDANDYYVGSWSKNLEDIFEGLIYPENNPLIFVEPGSGLNTYHYVNELTFGWGIYLNILKEESRSGMTSVSRQLTMYFRQLLNISKENYIESDISHKLVLRHIRNYLIQHPYTEKLIINLVNKVCDKTDTQNCKEEPIQ